MDDFATWLHWVAQPFSRLLCTPDLPSMEWAWEIHPNPLVITAKDPGLFNSGAPDVCFPKEAAYSAHTRMAIAQHRPSILDGFEQGIAALHARTQSTSTFPARYLFHLHASRHLYPVNIAYQDTINSKKGVPFRPIRHAQDLDTFIDRVRALRPTRRRKVGTTP